MVTCEYIYCRSSFAADAFKEAADCCPRCGFPRDRAKLTDPAFLGAIAVDGLPASVVDMHQILPAMPGVLEMQLFAMQRFNIERVLVQSVPPQATSLWGNDQLRELAAERGDLFWVSQFLDPRMPQATEALDKLAALGARVIKLLPPAGFQPDDPAFDGFWGTMERLGLVAMVHTGFITARHKKEEKKAGAFLNSRFANPLFFDQPARKFPDLNIILCHLGGALWYEEGAQMVTQHDNVWADVSGFGLFALRRLLALDATIDWRKVFWGNDSPPFAYPFNLRLHLDALERHGAQHLAPGLFRDNGRNFGQRFLAPAAGE